MLEHRQNSGFPVALCLRVSSRQHRQNPIKPFVNNSHICLIPHLFDPLSPKFSAHFRLAHTHLSVILYASSCHTYGTPRFFQAPGSQHPSSYSQNKPPRNNQALHTAFLWSWVFRLLLWHRLLGLSVLPALFKCINLNSPQPAASPLKVTVDTVG